MSDWFRRKLGSALSCAVGFHGACDGYAAMRVAWCNDLRCLCRCHGLTPLIISDPTADHSRAYEAAKAQLREQRSE